MAYSPHEYMAGLVAKYTDEELENAIETNSAILETLLVEKRKRRKLNVHVLRDSD